MHVCISQWVAMATSRSKQRTSLLKLQVSSTRPATATPDTAPPCLIHCSLDHVWGGRGGGVMPLTKLLVGFVYTYT